MKFNKKALKKAFKHLPENYNHPIMDMLSDDCFNEVYSKFVSPIEDLLFMVVFGEDYCTVSDSFNCPGNDDGTKPIAWDNGFIVDHFMNYMKDGNLKEMLICIDELKTIWDEFYKEKK